MKSQTSLVAQQAHLSEWAEQIRECKLAKKYDISKVNKLVLTSDTDTKWPYAARCNVSLDDGKIEFFELQRPN